MLLTGLWCTCAREGSVGAHTAETLTRAVRWKASPEAFRPRPKNHRTREAARLPRVGGGGVPDTEITEPARPRSRLCNRGNNFLPDELRDLLCDTDGDEFRNLVHLRVLQYPFRVVSHSRNDYSSDLAGGSDGSHGPSSRVSHAVIRARTCFVFVGVGKYHLKEE